VKQIAVIAFGHVYFKAACAAENVDWQAARHISRVGLFRGLTPANTRLITHVTASDRRQSAIVIEAKRLGFDV
jgi:hypothetical protein